VHSSFTRFKPKLPTRRYIAGTGALYRTIRSHLRLVSSTVERLTH
jgi:hypothetical protein